MDDPCPVLCAGIIVVDHVAAPIHHLPQSGELLLTDDCQLHIGGCAANVSIDLAKLGIKSKVLGTVGSDLFGTFAVETLEKYGIETSGIDRCEKTPTSQTLVVNVRGDDRRFIHLPGANNLFSATRISETSGNPPRVLYVGGMFLMDGLKAAELATVFRRFREKGTITVLDVVTPGPKDYLSELFLLLPETDYFLPNEDEAKLMTRLITPKEQARKFHDLGAQAVIITRGRGGAAYLSDRDFLEVGTFPVEYVDGTGGGDAFVAGFIAGLLAEKNPLDCLTWGSALGASCVRKMGATEGVFHGDELARFLGEHRLEVVKAR
ncbi:carbohydrate kinase family protein [bacterium]|nr:carbohydrate kinase family protein [bacterium]